MVNYKNLNLEDNGNKFWNLEELVSGIDPSNSERCLVALRQFIKQVNYSKRMNNSKNNSKNNSNETYNGLNVFSDMNYGSLLVDSYLIRSPKGMEILKVWEENERFPSSEITVLTIELLSRLIICGSESSLDQSVSLARAVVSRFIIKDDNTNDHFQKSLFQGSLERSISTMHLLISIVLKSKVDENENTYEDNMLNNNNNYSFGLKSIKSTTISNLGKNLASDILFAIDWKSLEFLRFLNGRFLIAENGNIDRKRKNNRKTNPLSGFEEFSGILPRTKIRRMYESYSNKLGKEKKKEFASLKEYAPESTNKKLLEQLRMEYLRLVFAFLRVGDASLIHTVLMIPELINRIISGLLFDDVPIVIEFFRKLKEYILLNKKVMKKYKILLFTPDIMEQLAALMMIDGSLTQNKGSDEQFKMLYQERKEFFNLLCCSSKYGIVFINRNWSAYLLDPLLNEEESSLNQNMKKSKIHSDLISLKNYRILKFITCLKPATNVRQKELFLDILKTSPELLQSWLKSVPLKYEPKDSNWYDSMSLISTIIETVPLPTLCPIDSESFDSFHFTHSPPQSGLYFDFLFPSVIPKFTLQLAISKISKNRQYMFNMRFKAFEVIIYLFKRLKSCLEQIEKAKKFWENHPQSETLWDSFSDKVLNYLKLRLPTLESLESVLHWTESIYLDFISKGIEEEDGIHLSKVVKLLKMSFDFLVLYQKYFISSFDEWNKHVGLLIHPQLEDFKTEVISSLFKAIDLSLQYGSFSWWNKPSKSIKSYIGIILIVIFKESESELVSLGKNIVMQLLTKGGTSLFPHNSEELDLWLDQLQNRNSVEIIEDIFLNSHKNFGENNDKLLELVSNVDFESKQGSFWKLFFREESFPSIPLVYSFSHLSDSNMFIIQNIAKNFIFQSQCPSLIGSLLHKSLNQIENYNISVDNIERLKQFISWSDAMYFGDFGDNSKNFENLFKPIDKTIFKIICDHKSNEFDKLDHFDLVSYAFWPSCPFDKQKDFQSFLFNYLKSNGYGQRKRFASFVISILSATVYKRSYIKDFDSFKNNIQNLFKLLSKTVDLEMFLRHPLIYSNFHEPQCLSFDDETKNLIKTETIYLISDIILADTDINISKFVDVFLKENNPFQSNMNIEKFLKIVSFLENSQKRTIIDMFIANLRVNLKITDLFCVKKLLLDCETIIEISDVEKILSHGYDPLGNDFFVSSLDEYGIDLVEIYHTVSSILWKGLKDTPIENILSSTKTSVVLEISKYNFELRLKILEYICSLEHLDELNSKIEIFFYFFQEGFFKDDNFTEISGSDHYSSLFWKCLGFLGENILTQRFSDNDFKEYKVYFSKDYDSFWFKLFKNSENLISMLLKTFKQSEVNTKYNIIVNIDFSCMMLSFLYSNIEKLETPDYFLFFFNSLIEYLILELDSPDITSLEKSLLKSIGSIHNDFWDLILKNDKRNNILEQIFKVMELISSNRTISFSGLQCLYNLVTCMIDNFDRTSNPFLENNLPSLVLKLHKNITSNRKFIPVMMAISISTKDDEIFKYGQLCGVLADLLLLFCRFNTDCVDRKVGKSLFSVFKGSVSIIDQSLLRLLVGYQRYGVDILGSVSGSLFGDISSRICSYENLSQSSDHFAACDILSIEDSWDVFKLPIEIETNQKQLFYFPFITPNSLDVETENDDINKKYITNEKLLNYSAFSLIQDLEPIEKFNLLNPAFTLPFILQYAQNITFEFSNFIESGFLQYVFLSLSSSFISTRRIGYNILKIVYQKILVEQEQYKKITDLVLPLYVFQNSISILISRKESDQLIEYPQISSISLNFFAKSIYFIYSRPHDPQYVSLCKFFTNNPFVDLDKDVPLFFKLFFGTTNTLKKDIVWILKVILGGLQSFKDHLILRRKKVYEMLLMCHSNYQNDSLICKLVRKIFLRAIYMPKAAKDLVRHIGIISWIITNFVQTSEFSMENLELYSWLIEMTIQIILVCGESKDLSFLHEEKRNLLITIIHSITFNNEMNSDWILSKLFPNNKFEMFIICIKNVLKYEAESSHMYTKLLLSDDHIQFLIDNMMHTDNFLFYEIISLQFSSFLKIHNTNEPKDHKSIQTIFSNFIRWSEFAFKVINPTPMRYFSLEFLEHSSEWNEMNTKIFKSLAEQGDFSVDIPKETRKYLIFFKVYCFEISSNIESIEYYNKVVKILNCKDLCI